MTKPTPSKQPNRRQLYLAAGVGLVLILVLALLASRPPVSVVEAISPSGYQAQFVESATNHLLLDVRTPEEFASGHIPGAVNLPVESLPSRLSEVPGGQPIVVYCRSGNRSAQAAQILAQAGYSDIYNLGGLNDWAAQGFPVE